MKFRNIKIKYEFKGTLLAFTLAEILITLGIIGVIATMTIPSLIQTTQNKAWVTSARKAFSVISQATLTSVSQNGDVSGWTITDGSSPAILSLYTNLYAPYLKVSNVCQATTGCWASGYTKALNGSVNALASTDSLGLGYNTVLFTLVDGANVDMDVWNQSDISTYFGVTITLPNSVVFWVDVNGAKSPNKVGRDTFAFVLTEKGVVPAGKDDSSNCAISDASSRSGIECAAVVLRNGDITY